MSPMKESTVVRDISRQLRHAKRFFVNNHGTIMSQSGVPDFITMDETTRFLAIEAKAPGQKPRVNQMRRALEILKSGGRYVVAYAGFDLLDLDKEVSPTTRRIIIPEVVVGDTEFELVDNFPPTISGSIEYVLE